MSRPLPPRLVRLSEPAFWASLVLGFAVWAETNPPNNFGIFGQPRSGLLTPLLIGGALNTLGGWVAGLIVTSRNTAERMRPLRALGLLTGLIIGVSAAQLVFQLAIVALLEPDVTPRPAWQAGVNAATAAVFVLLGVLYRLARDGVRRRTHERLLAEEAERLRHALGARDDALVTLGTGRNTVRVPVGEIRYLRAAGNYFEVVTTDRTHLVYGQLKAALGSLPKDRFVRIHRSFVVASTAIRKIEGGEVCLSDTVLPIGAAYRPSVLHAFKDLPSLGRASENRESTGPQRARGH